MSQIISSKTIALDKKLFKMAKIALIFVVKFAKTDVLAKFHASIRTIFSHFSVALCLMQWSLLNLSIAIASTNTGSQVK